MSVFHTWSAAMKAARFHAGLTGHQFFVRAALPDNPYGNWCVSMNHDVRKAWDPLRAKRYRRERGW